jgi:hypothetical protein
VGADGLHALVVGRRLRWVKRTRGAFAGRQAFTRQHSELAAPGFAWGLVIDDGLAASGAHGVEAALDADGRFIGLRISAPEAHEGRIDRQTAPDCRPADEGEAGEKTDG